MNSIRNRLPAWGGRGWRLIFFLREYFFPSGCALCDAALITVSETYYGLCEHCRNTIEEQGVLDQEAPDRLSTAELCDLCGRPLISEHKRCLPCRNAEEPVFDRAMVLFPYTGKYHRLLGAYKFGKNLALGNFFAEKIREALASASPDTVIVPVPPRSGKIKKTGWDQVEYLAALLEKGRGSKNMLRKSITIKNVDMRVSRCLRRLPSKVQKELNQEERKKNLRGRIILKGAAPKTVVLIDDVITTGSTLDACAAVLKEGGAEKVYGLCLFYT